MAWTQKELLYYCVMKIIHEYVVENDDSMSVHIGKVHSENIECGMCESVFENLENWKHI